MQRRLERSTTDRVMSGVCGGLADYLAIDATVVRVFFVIATIFTAGVWVLVYIALLVLMPLPGQRAPIDEWLPGSRSAAPSEAAPSEGGEPRPAAPRAEGPDRRPLFGYVLIVLGLVFLLGNVGAFRLLQWSVAWPLVLIALGVLLLLQRSQR